MGPAPGRWLVTLARHGPPAGQLRLPVGTVKSRLSHARHALAEQFGDEREGVSNA